MRATGSLNLILEILNSLILGQCHIVRGSFVDGYSYFLGQVRGDLDGVPKDLGEGRKQSAAMH